MSKKLNYVFDTDDELCHWGILGQRWGHRRFQNEDGSLTAEGRERYGYGGAKEKSDVQKYKAKVSFKTQQYKANLKSKTQKQKDARAAKEERNRIKENSKTTLLARKEQGKFDRLNKKELAKLDSQGRPAGMKFTRTKNMSDEDLQRAIDRLKLQAEYNKQYVLATQPNGALAKADRFFEGPTGKVVAQIAVNTIPDLIKTATSKAIDNNLKYSNKLDREKIEADIAKTKADTEKALSDAKKDKGLSDIEKREKEANIARTEANRRQFEAVAAKNYKEILGDNYEYFWTTDHELGIRKKKKK